MEHPFTWVGALGIPARFQFLATSILLMAIVLALAARARSALQAEHAVVPDTGPSLRNLFELLTEGIGDLASSVIGHGSERYVPLFSAFFLLILVSNLIGLVPGFAPPTSNFNITFALGTASFLVFNYYGFKEKGLGYLKSLMGPVWWLAVLMVPLELIGLFVRPASLGLRLYGNLFGDHLVLEIFTGLTKVGVPVVFYGLGTLVSVIQAFVFTLLSMIYVALAISHDH
jgi:F-type H+-transporting ATPase subunit a